MIVSKAQLLLGSTCLTYASCKVNVVILTHAVAYDDYNAYKSVITKCTTDSY